RGEGGGGGGGGGGACSRAVWAGRGGRARGVPLPRDRTAIPRDGGARRQRRDQRPALRPATRGGTLRSRTAAGAAAVGPCEDAVAATGDTRPPYRLCSRRGRRGTGGARADGLRRHIADRRRCDGRSSARPRCRRD